MGFGNEEAGPGRAKGGDMVTVGCRVLMKCQPQSASHQGYNCPSRLETLTWGRFYSRGTLAMSSHTRRRVMELLLACPV